MKKAKQLLSVLLCCIMLLGIFPAAAFAEGVTGDEGKLLIPFEKTWNDNDNALQVRPASITVTLYKYAGTEFDSSTAIPIESKTITADDGWKCTFDISAQQIVDEDGETYKFNVVESPVAGYNETAHTDPEVLFTPPSAEDGWNRITPCAELQIATSGTYKSVVVAKKGNDYVIWTVDALSQTEREIIFESAKTNISGFGQGNFENAVFISGVGGSSHGMTVTMDQITFDDPNAWSFFGTGLYSKSSTEANGAMITNTLQPITEPGSITITKSFAGLPENLRPVSVSFSVTGPDDFSTTVTLSAENQWTSTINNLNEGIYTVTEGAADVDGYVSASNFTGGSTTVTLTKSALDTDTNKYTVSSETVTFKNTYTRLGSLKIVKDFGADSELNKDSANIGKFVFTVAGPDGFETRTIELPIASSETPWEFTIENLPAGDYTVTEDPASAARDSYVLTLNGAEAGDDAVVAAVTNGSTAEAKITNTYTKNMGEEIHNPASFKIVKTDEQGNKLSGAEFTLYNEDGSAVSTQTTDSKGEAVFGGFTKAAEYTLKETKAPEGYVATEQTWTVTVKLKDGDPTIQISEDGKFWNKIYNWVVSSDPKDVDGVLTVTNARQTGSLVITKTVENNRKLGPEAEEYTFSLTIGNEEQTFTLKDGESKTIENIPYGTTYKVLEEVSEDASWNVVSPVGGKAEGTISQEKTTVDFVNRYEYANEAEMVVFSAVKQSSKDGKALAGAEFTVYSDKDCKTSVATATTDANGKLAFGFKSAGSFYLKETKAPSGYVLSDKVVELTVSNKGYVVDRVENEDQTDTTTIVPVLELTVKGAELLTGSTSVFLLENDPESYIDITVNKLWKNDKEAGKRPETITVTLYKDGVKYDSKTISEKDKWTCTWKNLPSQYKWTVDESNLPAGYTKSITQKGNTFTITNTYSSIPGTGDSSAPILWALLVLTTAAGAVLTIRKLRKEKG